MKSREDIQNLVADILKDLRHTARLSKSRMACLLNVDERTYRRYEDGEASPSLAVFITMLDSINAPVLPIILRHLYPESFKDLTPNSPTEDVRKSVSDYIARDASDREVRQIAYLIHGPHGSTLEAQLQMFTAIDHMQMDVRLAIAKLTLNAWEIESARNDIINPEHVMPDMDLLRSAIIKAQKAVIEGRSSYTSAIK